MRNSNNSVVADRRFRKKHGNGVFLRKNTKNMRKKFIFSNEISYFFHQPIDLLNRK